MSVRHLLYGISLFFMLASIALAADAFFTYQDLLKAPAAVAPAPSLPAAERVIKKPKTSDYMVVVRRDLFASEPGPPDKPKAANPGAAPRTPSPASPPRKPSPPSSFSAKYRLVGTTVLPEGGGFAILEEVSSKRQSVHPQGDRVEGALIEKVRRGEIQLRIEGHPEVLTVSEGKENGAPAERPAPAGPSGPPNPETRKVLQRPQVAQAGAPVKGQFRAEIYRQPGGEAGVQVFPVQRTGIFQALGLQAGDVVVGVDGSAVRSEDEFFAAMTRMLGRAESTMQVLRDGKRLNLSFQIQ